MANSAQARKRARQSETRRQQNTSLRSEMRTAIKKVRAAVEAGDKTAAAAALVAAQPELARGVSKGVLHKNMASRKFSRLTKRVAALA